MTLISRFPKGLLAALTFLIIEGTVCAAESPKVLTAAWSSGSPAGFSGEWGFSRLFGVGDEPRFFLGPRFAMLYNSQGNYDFFFPVGVQGEIWAVNAVGMGLRAEVVIPYFVGQLPLSFRVTPMVTARFLHLGEAGALGFHFAVPYDSQKKWYVQLGLTLQLDGVSNTGSSP
ncbi:MAG: hypothetical protein HYX41_06315 [Bdellovibrio sp.]|nr:hypothetical protein [Bdellovibrio sp.]